MTRLSDSLRGLADRAPIADATVSTVSASRRIHRNRRLRAAANATAGVGAAAVVAVAAINPGMGASPKAAGEQPDIALDDGRVAPGYDSPVMGAGDSMLAWGWCGSYPFESDVPNLSTSDTLTVEGVDGELTGGELLSLDAVLTPGTTGAFETFGTQAFVLWDGLLVGIGTSSVAEVASLDATAGQAIDTAVATDLVNCWDGTALPAGDYELVAYQDLTALAAPPVEASAEPTVTPVEPVEPSLAPVDPTPAPDEATSSNDVATPGIAADAATMRVVSEPVAFTIAGDKVDDPFGQYLTPEPQTVNYPSDYLYPEQAREEYAAHLVSGRWDMAPGTQRVVKTGDSENQDDPNAWLNGYYGCSADGSTVPSFPAVSADWALLDVDTNLPRSISTSYGWIVDGNPEVDFTVTNTSGHSLPGFWGQPNTSLYLVKDGKVVAQSYLVTPDPYDYSVQSSADGMLAPGAALGGTYLWRDINACWTGDAPQTLTPGTYTVLSAQDVYLDNGTVMYIDPMYSIDGSRTDAAPGAEVATSGGGEAEKAAGAAIAPAPYDGTYDSVSFQVWTSLGKITVG